MWYVIRGFDAPASAPIRRRARAAHLARLNELRTQGRVLTAGPLMKDDQSASTWTASMHAGSGAPAAADTAPPLEFVGSLMVLEFENLEAARSWANAEPYLATGVFERMTVDTYVPTLP